MNLQDTILKELEEIYCQKSEILTEAKDLNQYSMEIDGKTFSYPDQKQFKKAILTRLTDDKKKEARKLDALISRGGQEFFSLRFSDGIKDVKALVNLGYGAPSRKEQKLAKAASKSGSKTVDSSGTKFDIPFDSQLDGAWADGVFKIYLGSKPIAIFSDAEIAEAALKPLLQSIAKAKAKK